MQNADVAATEDTPSESQVLTRRVVKGGAWVALSTYWTIGFGFIANIFITRLLSPEAFGGFALAMFFAQFFRVQSRLGLDKAYSQHPVTDALSVGTFLGLESLGSLASLVIGLCAVILLPLFGYSRDVSQVAFVLLLSLLCESWGNTANALLDKALHFRQSSWVEAIVFPLSYVPAFWLATRGVGVWSLVAQSAAYNVLACAGKWWLGGRLLARTLNRRLELDRQLAVHFLKFGVSVGVITLIGMLTARLDTWLIGTFLSATDLGYYDRAIRMSLWPSLLFNNLIHRTVFITYARLYPEPERFIRTAEQVTWVLILVSIPISLVLMTTAGDLVTLIYGEKWLSSVPYLRILAVASIGRVLWANANVLYTAMGKPKEIVKWSMVQLALMAALGVPLTLLYGARGTAIAFASTLFLTDIAVYLDLSRRQGVRLERVIMPLFMVGFAVYLGHYLLRAVITVSSGTIGRLLIDVGSIGILYGIVILIFDGKSTLQRMRTLWGVLSQK